MHEPELPGADLVERGLRDLRAGRESVEGLLVEIGRPRLAGLGVQLPPSRVEEPEMRLYELLQAQHADGAHSVYNGLIRRLVSYERALELERRGR